MTAVLLIGLKSLMVTLILLSLVPALVWLERKGSAFIQDRPGPNRAHIGFLRLGGMIHLVADAIKMFTKEDIIPSGVNKLYYLLAPIIVTAVSICTVAIVPFADNFTIGSWTFHGQVIPSNLGILWFFAIVSLSVFGVVFAGWASNNKYSLMGGLRASASMISYEIPMGLSVIGAIMMYGTLDLMEIVQKQGDLLFGFLPAWGIFLQPLGALIFIVCAFAETNRTPFDIAEGESELVAGYHTEYSAMKFGLFFLGEYAAMTVSSAMIVTLFFGGWQVPFVTTDLLRQWAQPIILGSLVAGALVCLFLAKAAWGYHRSLQGRFGDARDQEGKVFLVVLLGLAALLGGGALAFSQLATLPAWLPPVFAAMAQVGMFMAKVLFFCWIFVWVRWTLPRFRYDQLMDLGWKQLLPLALANIFLTGIVISVMGW